MVIKWQNRKKTYTFHSSICLSSKIFHSLPDVPNVWSIWQDKANVRGHQRWTDWWNWSNSPNFKWTPCYIYTETCVYMYLLIQTWLCVHVYRCVCVTKTVLQNHLFVFKSFHFIHSTERKTQHSIIFGVIFFSILFGRQ